MKNRQFKQTFDHEETRRRRDEVGVSLRRAVREEFLAKRRNLRDADEPLDVASPGFSAAHEQRLMEVQQRLSALPQRVNDLRSQDQTVVHDSVLHIRKILSIGLMLLDHDFSLMLAQRRTLLSMKSSSQAAFPI